MKRSGGTPRNYGASTRERALITRKDPSKRMDGAPGNGICHKCHALIVNKRWIKDDEQYKKLIKSGDYEELVCPACKKLADKQPGGMVYLSGQYFVNHRLEIMQLIENEGKRTGEKNAVERIMETHQEGGSTIVTTTTVSLAQRLGRLLYRAHKGDLEFKWSHGSKLAKITWHRE